MTDSDEDYYLPLQDQRVFGAGIRRKKINFVPEASVDQSLPTTGQRTDIGSRYLSIVLPKSRTESPEPTATSKSDISEQASRQPSGETTAQPIDEPSHLPSEQGSPLPPSPNLCPICAQLITSAGTTDSTETTLTSHESSIAHQLCLAHSHPPSHLPRGHIGVRYLTNYGWDPDSRLGLGARQEGIAVPIKAREKRDTGGLRERLDDDAAAARKKKAGAEKEKDGKVVKMNARELKVRDIEAKRRAEKLRANFYGPDLEKYLGPDPDNLQTPGQFGKPG